MSQINGTNQPQHPIEDLAYWGTKPPKLRAMAERYDTLCRGDPIMKKQLDDLLAWTREEALSDVAFDNSGADQ